MPSNPEVSASHNHKLDGSFTSNTQLNSSTAKAKYSIPKAPRWQPSKKQSSDSMYELPDLKSHRSASFGSGNKLDISKQNTITPPPNVYQIPSQLDQNIKKRSGITMGAGRSLVKSNSAFAQKPFMVPGPLQYNPHLMDTPKPFTIPVKREDLSDKMRSKNPGPGNYQTLDLYNSKLRCPISKYENCSSTIFPKRKRVNDYEEQVKFLNPPGPGAYQFNGGSNAASRFKHDRGRRFGHSQRKSIVEKSITPGPGAYSNAFSDFTS